ncbi:sperm-associated antigen 17 isoform X2 [Gambusia affinis]|uniref:sperm-associated antigen 17 isoform X2 n=1 Tax=Gambusia affinis TaxID=33528 RepID=UPI001CDBC307|nr:sperm-associated antigen 17 isoform X2 [Gambusia affinis]
MPPAGKKGSGKKSSPVQPFNKNWEADLIKAQFEDTWLASVSLVVGDGPEEEEELTKSLVLSFECPQRKLFSLISWDSTVEKIYKLGNPKAKKPDNLPLFYECTEPAKTLLDAGEEIPIDLVAKLVKFQLLEVKVCDQKRREAEQLKIEEQKEKTRPQSEGKGKQKDKKEKKGKGQTPGKGQAAGADPSKDKKTKLKRRGDPETPVYIDDEPEDGPQHYILIVGFYQPNLIGVLNTIGVHVANVIKLCSKHKEVSPEPVELNVQEEAEQSSPVVPAEVPESTRKLNLFWTHLRSALDRGPPDSKLYDVIQLNYIVPDLTLPFEIPDSHSVLELGNRVFDDVARLIYDCLQWRRQHQHYRNNVRLIPIPTAVLEDAHSVEAHAEPVAQLVPRSRKKPTKASCSPISESKLPLTVSVNMDMRCYNNLLDRVPPEACSVPLILHCMLEQVVISSELPVLPVFPAHEEDEKPAPGPWLDCDLVNYMLQSFLPLLNTEEEKHHLLDEVLTTVEKEEDKERLMESYGTEHAQRPGDPVILRYHDERGMLLQNITVSKGFNPAEIETSILKTSPVSELIQSVAEQRNGDTCWRGVKQQLQHHCTDEGMPWSEVERLFDQSMFEAMPLTTVDQMGVLLNDDETQQTQTVIPWANPLLYAKQKLQTPQTIEPTFLTEDPGSSEQPKAEICSWLDLYEIQNWRQRCLIDWYYTEHHSPTVFPQVLQKASEEYCCMDIFRETYANILYVFCHNPMNSHGLYKHFWDEALHTDVKFRKYLEHVADKIYNWTKEEEEKREEMLIKSQMPPETPTDLECPAVEEEALEPVIRKESLKAWKLEQERLKKEELDKKSKKESKGKGQKKTEDDKSSDKKRKAPTGEKMSKPDKRGSSAKIPTGSAISIASSDAEKGGLQTEELDNRFIGYTMDGQLIHVSGCVQQIYTSDGGRITVENVSFVEGSTLMKVALRKDGHHFYTHVNHVVTKHLKPASEPQDKKNMEPKDGVKVLEQEAVKLCSFSAVLQSQIYLSYSFYGATGQYKESLEEEAAKEEIPKASPEEPVTWPSPNSGSMTPRQSIMECPEQPAEPSPQPPPPPLPPFNSLSLSVPNGLLLQFQLDNSQGESTEYGVLIRQSFPFHRKAGLDLPDKSLSQELYRVITNQGVVIRYLRDGAAEVLFADGSVSFTPGPGPGPGPVLVSDNEQTEETSEKEDEPQKRSWQTTTSTGERIWTTGPTYSVIPTTSLCTFLATDPVTQEVMLTREDLVVTVKSPDGSIIADHADGTRITTLFLVTPPNEEVPNCVTTPEEHEDVCDKEEKMSETLETHELNETVSNDKSEEEKDSTRERVVIVEKEGCASVVMYPSRHAAHVFLADGTIITGNNQAEYEVFPSRDGFLHIQTDGKCVYTSDLSRSEVNACSPSNRPGVYTMSHTDEVVCDVSDKNGNHFQVVEYGQTLMLNTSPAPETPTQEEEEMTDKSSATLDVKHKDYCPRIFLVYEDGSGTELLNSHIVEEQLQEAYSDPTIALLKEPLPDRQDAFGITILKPAHQSVWSKWVLKKQNPDITPPNLRNRSDEFYTAEVSPPLGSGTSVALSQRERCASSLARQRVWSCPRVLEIRELSQHRPFTTVFRDAVDSRLKDYIERLMQRELLAEQMKLKELRSDEETAQATDLLSLILSFAELDDESHDCDSRSSSSKAKSAAVDYSSMYSQGVKASVEQSTASEETENLGAGDLLDKSRLSTARKESRWHERLELHRQEMSEEKACKEALRKKSCVPYFHPENFQIYQNLLQCQRPSIKRTSQDLPLPTKVGSVDKSTSVDRVELDMKDASTQSTSQLYNLPVPPPESRAEESESMSERRQSDLPKHSSGLFPTVSYPSESSLKSSSRRFKSVLVDVTGQPRSAKVRLPSYLRGSKPCSMPNKYFLKVEEPVRRHCRIATLSDPGAELSGFLLNPPRIDFGTQQEGTCTTVTVGMKNLGVDPSRFTVKQPPSSTGLRVIYHPGPVPSGLQAELQVQLFSMCDGNEPKKYVSEDIIILTESDVLYLPVTAVILTERCFVEKSMCGCRQVGAESICSHSWPGSHMDEPPAP